MNTPEQVRDRVMHLATRLDKASTGYTSALDAGDPTSAAEHSAQGVEALWGLVLLRHAMDSNWTTPDSRNLTVGTLLQIPSGDSDLASSVRDRVLAGEDPTTMAQHNLIHVNPLTLREALNKWMHGDGAAHHRLRPQHTLVTSGHRFGKRWVAMFAVAALNEACREVCWT